MLKINPQTGAPWNPGPNFKPFTPNVPMHLTDAEVDQIRADVRSKSVDIDGGLTVPMMRQNCRNLLVLLAVTHIAYAGAFIAFAWAVSGGVMQ